jgi:biotin carboxyl carrier protein
MRSPRHAIGVGVGSFLLLIGAAAPAAAADPPTVTVSAPLQRELVEWDEFTGQFWAKDSVEIRARVSGYLTEIHFTDGQIVNPGDLLFVIDPRPYEATQAAAQAQLGQATAQVELAQRQLGRSAELRKKDFEPASSYDQRVSELKVATAAIESANAAIRSAQLNVEFTHITAPLLGRISNHQVSVGNLVSGSDSASTPALTTIVSLDPIWFYFDMRPDVPRPSLVTPMRESELAKTESGSVTPAPLSGAERTRRHRALKKAAPSTAPLLYERADWQLYIRPETLPQKAGCNPRQIGCAVLKEVVDNGLDFGAELGIERIPGGYRITDSGPGIDPAAVPILFAVNRPLLSTKLKRLPLRGMLGNGLRVVMGAVAAFGGAIAVTTRGHRLDLAVDRVTGKTNVTSDTSVPDMLGTTVEIMLRQFGGEEFRPAELSLKVAREGKQYTGPSRPSWYNTDDFGELLARVTPHTATVARVVRDVFAIDTTTRALPPSCHPARSPSSTGICVGLRMTAGPRPSATSATRPTSPMAGQTASHGSVAPRSPTASRPGRAASTPARTPPPRAMSSFC